MLVCSAKVRSTLHLAAGRIPADPVTQAGMQRAVLFLTQLKQTGRGVRIGTLRGTLPGRGKRCASGMVCCDMLSVTPGALRIEELSRL